MGYGIRDTGYGIRDTKVVSDLVTCQIFIDDFIFSILNHVSKSQDLLMENRRDAVVYR